MQLMESSYLLRQRAPFTGQTSHAAVHWFFRRKTNHLYRKGESGINVAMLPSPFSATVAVVRYGVYSVNFFRINVAYQ